MRQSALVQIMACRLFGTKPLSKRMLGYYQLDLQEQTVKCKSKMELLFIQENAFENVVCEMKAILSRRRIKFQKTINGYHTAKSTATKKPKANRIYLCSVSDGLVHVRDMEWTGTVHWPSSPEIYSCTMSRSQRFRLDIDSPSIRYQTFNKCI